ncbi:MAG: class I SAM-dependent methyltransferase [Proteobacteria bacterium]|nr:class I SAM-dependent methyltransferase [Pseudomonadota bacterium]
MSKIDKTEINEQIAASIKNFSSRAKDEGSRQKAVIELPEFIQQKAALISAHLLLPSGSRIVDMGCETGEITYVLAQLNPRAELIGVDHDPAAIEFARKNYKLPNLSFRLSDISIPELEDESLDAIINSNILHGIYSAAGYNQIDVSLLLEKQIHKLKPGGTMLIRDYMMPPEGEFVLLELPDTPSEGMGIPHLSEADLLLLFSQSARPLPAGGCEGFFIEELKPRRDGTRLFRLPHKWAIEFIHRKNYRAHWDQEIREEYTFFTYQDYRREFARIGMRMTFSAPYWNPWVVKNCFKGRFQLYSGEYKPMSYPATNYFIVSQKVADKQSLVLEERRPSQNPVGELQIMVVRDKKGGALHELVKRPGEHCDIIPYRITPDNRLVIFVRSGYPRPIVNAVTRGSSNLDGKKWSGHLIEPIAMDTVEMSEDAEGNRHMIFEYVRHNIGLRPKTEGSWYIGDTYFPSPDRIDEAIEPVFIEVENPYKTSWPLPTDKSSLFTELGMITELDGADIILASQVGLLPEPRLEMYVFDLMTRYNIPLPRWIGESMPKLPGQAVKKIYEPDDLLKEPERTEFEEEKTESLHLKPVKAVFIEEGKVGRTTRGLSAQDIEFIVSDDGVENIAVILPITRDWDNNLLVALDPKIMPVPNRLGGDGAMLNAPSFVLPKDVRTVEDAKAFIASKFGVSPEQVNQLGESYFTHVGVTPQRIYPFTVVSAPESSAGSVMRYTMMKKVDKYCRVGRIARDTLKLLARVQMQANDGYGLAAQRDLQHQKNKGFSLSTEKVAVDVKNISYSAIPSRILGQRGMAGDETRKEPEPTHNTPESAAAAASGKKLSLSYAQTKLHVKENPGIEKIDRNINAISKSLFPTRHNKLEPTPPSDKPKGRH